MEDPRVRNLDLQFDGYIGIVVNDGFALSVSPMSS